MSIADQLTTLNTTKIGIKNAIEAKGVTVGTVPFADYATKISEISGGGGITDPAIPLVWSQELQDQIYTTVAANAAATAVWSRPTDWLAMPAITATDQRFDGLYAVYNSTTNWVSITAAGDFTVDWGDGSAPENYSLGVQALHNYVWDNVSSATTTTEGFRQVIITVTPQAGSSLTAFNLGQPVTDVSVGYASQWLDMQVAMNNTGSFDFGNINFGTRPRKLKRFRWLGNNDQGIFTDFFRNFNSLETVEMDTTGATSMDNMFRDCVGLRIAPALDTSTVTTTASMFMGCTSLITVPALNLSAATDISSMFQSCKLLQAIGSWSLRPSSVGSVAATLVFSTCNNLLIIPNTETALFTSFSCDNCNSLITVPTLNLNATSYVSMFQNCYNLESVTAINPVNTLPTNITSMFRECRKLIPPVFTVSQVNTTTSAFQNSGIVSLNGFEFTREISSSNNMFDGSNLGGTIVFPTGVNGGSFFLNTLIENVTFTTNNNVLSNPVSNCFKLKKANITLLFSSTITSINTLFSNCINLESVNFTLGTNTTFVSGGLSGAFSNCPNLREINGLKFSTGTTAVPTTAFSGCVSLSKLTLTNLVATVTVANCALGPVALEELFTSLGTASARTITITGNWGAALLTQTQRNIATNKGWTIVG